jgi:hypothetical protein
MAAVVWEVCIVILERVTGNDVGVASWKEKRGIRVSRRNVHWC